MRVQPRRKRRARSTPQEQRHSKCRLDQTSRGNLTLYHAEDFLDTRRESGRGMQKWNMAKLAKAAISGSVAVDGLTQREYIKVIRAVTRFDATCGYPGEGPDAKEEVRPIAYIEFPLCDHCAEPLWAHTPGLCSANPEVWTDRSAYRRFRYNLVNRNILVALCILFRESFRFDSTLGYPGEGPRGDVPEGKMWKKKEILVVSGCSTTAAKGEDHSCQYKHMHRGLSGASRRLAEKKKQEAEKRGDAPPPPPAAGAATHYSLCREWLNGRACQVAYHFHRLTDFETEPANFVRACSPKCGAECRANEHKGGDSSISAVNASIDVKKKLPTEAELAEDEKVNPGAVPHDGPDNLDQPVRPEAVVVAEVVEVCPNVEEDEDEDEDEDDEDEDEDEDEDVSEEEDDVDDEPQILEANNVNPIAQKILNPKRRSCLGGCAKKISRSLRRAYASQHSRVFIGIAYESDDELSEEEKAARKSSWKKVEEIVVNASSKAMAMRMTSSYGVKDTSVMIQAVSALTRFNNLSAQLVSSGYPATEEDLILEIVETVNSKQKKTVVERLHASGKEVMSNMDAIAGAWSGAVQVLYPNSISGGQVARAAWWKEQAHETVIVFGTRLWSVYTLAKIIFTITFGVFEEILKRYLVEYVTNIILPVIQENFVVYNIYPQPGLLYRACMHLSSIAVFVTSIPAIVAGAIVGGFMSCFQLVANYWRILLDVLLADGNIASGTNVDWLGGSGNLFSDVVVPSLAETMRDSWMSPAYDILSYEPFQIKICTVAALVIVCMGIAKIEGLKRAFYHFLLGLLPFISEYGFCAALTLHISYNLMAEPDKKLDWLLSMYRGPTCVDGLLKAQKIAAKTKCNAGDNWATCLASTTYGVRGFYGIMGILPGVFAGCGHNEKAAMEGRVFKHLPVFSPEAAVSSSIRWHSCTALGDIIAGTIQQVRPYTFDTWVSTFKPAKQQILRAIYEAGDYSGVDLFTASSFIKKEVALYANDDPVYKDPRWVQGCPPALSVLVGRYVRKAAKKFHYRFKPSTVQDVKEGRQIFYTCGMTSEGVGKALATAISLVSALKDPLDEIVFVEDDESRFDMHILGPHFALLDRIYRRIFPRKIANLLRRTAFMRGKSGARKTKPTKYGIAFTMQSGWPDTSFADTIINAILKYYVHGFGKNWVTIICGDDSVTVTTKSQLAALGSWEGIAKLYTGMGMEVTGFVRQHVLDVEFCSSIFYPSGDDFILMPKPGRFLAKLCWTFVNRSETEFELWVASIAATLVAFGRYEPLYHCLAQNVFSHLGSVRSSREINPYTFNVDGSSSTTQLDVLSFHSHRYGFGESAYLALCQHFSLVDFGVLDEHHLVRWMGEVDLAFWG